MTDKHSPEIACAYIQKRCANFAPKVGLILGSGLGQIAENINDKITLPYADIPGFPLASIPGHASQLTLGKVNTIPLACMQGRVHLYEGQQSWNGIKTAIRTLKLLGCETLIITNAAGSLHHEIEPGNLVMISDHINLQPGNPLMGPNDDAFGPRFVSMEDAYSPTLRKTFADCAKQLSIPLTSGTYLGICGPVFETPAEIHAFRNLGADLIGMSTVPEVIIARHCSMRVAAISIISNLAAGLSNKKISHEQTIKIAQQSSEQCSQLLMAALDVIVQ